MTWTIEAHRRGTRIDVTIVNPDSTEPLGPFVVRLIPSRPSARARIESLVGGPEPAFTVTLDDPSYQVRYASAELLNEVELIERIRSAEVR